MVFGVKEDEKHYIEREGVYGIAFNDKKQVAVVEVNGSGFLPGRVYGA